MATITKPNTFSAGAVIVAAEHNSNFDTIYNDYNGNISNANIASAAAIADTKLANITATGKVNFTALTVTSQAQGDVSYFDGTNWARLAAGTSGQFLKTNGAAANPAWAGGGGTPALIFGTTNVAGTALTSVRTDDTVAVFDATVPVTQAFGDSAATGSVAKASRRDHKHGMPAKPSSFLMMSGAIGASVTKYVMASNVGTDDAAADGVSTPIAIAGTIKNLYGRQMDANAGTKSITITLNGVDQSLSVSWGAGVTGNQSDTTNTVSVVAGDRVSFKCVNNQGSTITFRASVEFAPT